MPNDPKPSASDFLPLPHARLEILLALAPGEAHGFAIKRSVEQRRGGKRLRAGTLYEALARLHVDRLIEEVDAPAEEAGTSRWRYYRLSEFGRAVLAAELYRLDRLLALGRTLGITPEAEA